MVGGASSTVIQTVVEDEPVLFVAVTVKAVGARTPLGVPEMVPVDVLNESQLGIDPALPELQSS